MVEWELEINDISGLSSWGTLRNGWDNDEKQWMSVPQLANPRSGSLRHAFLIHGYKWHNSSPLGNDYRKVPQKKSRPG